MLDAIESTNLTSIHVGKIADTDPARGTVKVEILELGFTTRFIPIVMPFATSNTFYVMPNVGDRVMVLLSANGETGCVIGAIYTGQTLPPTAGSDALNMAIPSTVISGNVKITGNVEVTGDTSMNGSVVVDGSHSINGKDTLVIGSTDSRGDSNVSSGQ